MRHTSLKPKREKPRRTTPPSPRVGKADGKFRSPKLLKLAAKAPHCMRRACRAKNEGQVVAAHSNRQHRGKGTGLKAHDIPAFLCNHCHDLVDGRNPAWSADRAHEEWEDALFETILWLMREGHLRVIP